MLRFALGRSRRPHEAPRGYTLIELLVVLGVLGILASLAWPMATVAQQRASERELRRALWEIRDAIDAYASAVRTGTIAPVSATSGYPPTLATLEQPLPDLRVPEKTHRFLRRVPRDPFADPGVPAASSWETRSYRSSHQDFQAGDDVYDVRSRSARIGLNGIPLKEW